MIQGGESPAWLTQRGKRGAGHPPDLVAAAGVEDRC